MMKKKGLLIWFEMDRRPELLQLFINASDEIEFIHLFYRKRGERLCDLSPFEMIYWFDYKNPYQIIKKYKPDFIVGTTEGLLAISLIVAAKEMHIPYYGVQHGFTPEKILSLHRKIQRRSIFSASVLKTYFYTTRFYFSSLRKKNVRLILQYFKVLFSFYRMNPLNAVYKHNKYYWIKPNYYVCFSEHSSRHYEKLYDLNATRFKFLGIPCFDEFFKEISVYVPANDAEKYYVLVDTSFEEYKKLITQEQIQRCYKVLSEYCKLNNARLYIKLHPWSYKHSHYVNDETISFIKNISMNELGKLIAGSDGCFGFYSTLTMPIAFTKPTIQIKYDDVFEPTLADNHITPVVDFYTFQLTDIVFYPFTNSKEELRKKFLFATDGKSTERLKQILLLS